MPQIHYEDCNERRHPKPTTIASKQYAEIHLEIAANYLIDVIIAQQVIQRRFIPHVLHQNGYRLNDLALHNLQSQ